MTATQDKPLIKPPALKKGDGISIVAPASSPKRKKLEAAIETLEGFGYRPKLYRDICDGDGFLSGTDEERIDELHAAFADSDTTMILAARGGYGCGRILDRLDFDSLRRRPKVVCGYSDLTALHAAIQRHAGMVSFHGPNLIDGLGVASNKTASEFVAAMSLFDGTTTAGNGLATDDDNIESLVGGVTEGRLVGGNLAVFTSLIGTPDEPDLNDAILFLEDVHEPPYRIDRMLNQLRQSGRLGHLAGVVLGHFTDTGDSDNDSLAKVFRDCFVPLGVPVLAGVPFGHQHPNYPLPMGVRVRLDADQGFLTLLESVVADS